MNTIVHLDNVYLKLIRENIMNDQSYYPAGSKPVDTKINASILQPYSVGLAAANLKVGQTDLEVWPKEKYTHTDGEVTDHVTNTTTTGVDASGNHYSETVDTSLSIRAKWLSRDPWLKFPGLVMRGEYVQLWRLGDSDEYYWELMGISNHLRRKDLLLLVISNTMDENTTELTAHNSVFFELNTLDKHITLSTPNNDGEKCRYTIQLNYGDSNFSLSDDIGNSIVMDSIAELIQLKNRSNTFMRLDKNRLIGEALEEIRFKTKNFNVESLQTRLSGQTLELNYNSVQGQCSGEFGFNAANISYNTTSIKHNGKEIGADHTHGGVRRGDESTGSVE